MDNDDYVKFIRYAEQFIEKNNTGILAYINNHSFWIIQHLGVCVGIC